MLRVVETRSDKIRKADNKAKMEMWLESEFLVKVRTPSGQIGELRANERAILSMGEKGVQLIRVRYAPLNKV